MDGAENTKKDAGRTYSAKDILVGIGRQHLLIDFNGGKITSDAGLLAVREFEMELGIISEIAALLPDPRSQKFVKHSVERILTQQVYQILAGYPDGEDARQLRDDPTFQVIVGTSPDTPDARLCSPSTLNRFAHAYTRREAEMSPEVRPVLLEQREAQVGRIHCLSQALPNLFVRTRRQPPSVITLDLDTTDDPAHGEQQLTAYHEHYKQHQYLEFHIMDGATGFPLAAELRPGNAHASWGAVDTLSRVVTQLRQYWPNVTIQVRADNGLATPEMYEYCEKEGLLYAFGYAKNAVLDRWTAAPLSDLRTYHTFYSHREERVQRFERKDDYQAEDWSRPRSIIAKIELMPEGENRRYVVTNMPGPPEQIYRDFYVQRGRVPEQPIGELKNDLAADRLSSPRVLANCWKLLVHTLAYAIVVLFREAAAGTPSVAKAQVSTLRTMLWKVGAVVKTSAQQVHFSFSSYWPHQKLFLEVRQALSEYVVQVRQSALNAVAPTMPF